MNPGTRSTITKLWNRYGRLAIVIEKSKAPADEVIAFLKQRPGYPGMIRVGLPLREVNLTRRDGAAKGLGNNNPARVRVTLARVRFLEG